LGRHAVIESDNLLLKHIILGTNMKKNILMVQMYPVFGGAEVYYLRLSKLLCSGFHIVHLIASQQLRTYLISKNKNFYFIPNPLNRFYLLNLFRIIKIILKHKINIVHLNGERELCYAPFLKPFCKIVTTIHTDMMKDLRLRNIMKNKRPKSGQNLKKNILLFAASLTDKIICVSANIAKELRQRSFLRKKVLFIPHWPPERYLSSLHSRPNSIGGRFHLTFVGRLDKLKGIRDMLTACQGIRNLSVHLVGNGEIDPSYLKVSKELDVIFHGYQKDPLSYYLQSNIVVLPSYSEGGNPFCLLEAMSLGLPCIGSDIPAIREIITDRKDGLLFPVGEPAELRKAIMLLMNNAALRKLIGEAAREKMHDRFSNSFGQKRYLDCFKSVLQQ